MESNLVSSPCCFPKMDLDAVLSAYADIGFRKYEAFTSWAQASFDLGAPPQRYADELGRRNMRLVSMHLPPVTEDVETSLKAAVDAARFAKQAGASIVLFKAKTRPLYIQAARPFLDAIDSLGITPVVQNHAGTAITSINDYREVLAGINDDRMKAILEVGHFHKAGHTWREGLELLGDRIALVHVKDMKDGQSVLYGQGDVDLPALFEAMRARGYDGDYVVEIEQPGGNQMADLRAAANYLVEHCGARP